MGKGEKKKKQQDFIFEYYLNEFVRENPAKFKGLFLNKIYFRIISSKLLVVDFHIFLEIKMLSLVYDDIERQKVKEAFLAKHN